MFHVCYNEIIAEGIICVLSAISYGCFWRSYIRSELGGDRACVVYHHSWHPSWRSVLKLAKTAFFPFGKDIKYGGGVVSVLLNILWLIFGGIALAIESLTLGVIFCLTIVGIPFGLQFFKLAKLALMPFGAKIAG